MNKIPILRWASALAVGAFFLSAQAQVTLNIDAGQRGSTIGDRHYGLFFEEINHAGDGGLYAELIHNRSFEDNASNPDKWWAVGGAAMSVTTDGLLNEAQGHALRLEIRAAGDGVRNEGFWGINVVNGRTYRLSFWIRGEGSYQGTLTAELQTEEGTALGSTAIPVDVKGEWVKMTTEITATGDAPKGWFALKGDTPGTVVLDMVSLFPPTYKNRENGCRPDLAEMLEAMRPRFVRFPGGCYVEGVYANGSTNRFEWKKTIGPIEERPGHMNQNWGYRVSDGMGFHEMLQLTEDLGAEPLFVVNMGMGHGWAEDYQHIDEYIQEALDALEYCNGDAQTTKWGALRAQNGHPEPFNLRLIEIGNENYNFSSQNNNDQSDHYAERYRQFYDAIRKQHPEVTIIGNVEAWGTDNPSWRNPHPVDVVDEHYYRNPGWFVGQYNKYDSYSRSSHKIYVGEYAVTQDFGTQGHLTAALGEAVFMQGMENNSDVCVMNSYAPIFANINNYNWRPDMIQFDSRTSYGTPSYYVQQLFPNNVGKVNVKWTEENNGAQPSARRVGLSTWNTTATFDNARVTDAKGNVLFSDDFSQNNATWLSHGGVWEVDGGRLHQVNSSMQGAVYACDLNAGTDYTYEVEATKESGAEGFLVVFDYGDANNYCWWNLGGWNNTQHGVEVCMDGKKSTVASTDGSLETGRTYHVKIQVEGMQVKCYLDDQLLHDFTLPEEYGNRQSQGAFQHVGMSTWNTDATFDNVRLTDADGKVLYTDEFAAASSMWANNGGEWAVTGGQLRQTDTGIQGAMYVCDQNAGKNYTYEVEATKNSGNEGFLIVFNYGDAKNYCWWNLGGWGNTQHGVEVCTNGAKSTVASVGGSLETGRTYRVKIQVEGTRVRCYLDDQLLHDFTLPVGRKVYVSSNIDDEAGILYVKLVNPGSTAQSVKVNLANAATTGGSMVELTSTNGTDENSLENPRKVMPRESSLDVSGQQFEVEMPAYSLRILRLDVTDVQIVEEEPAELPEPVVQYGFEAGTGADDSGTFQGTLQGDAAIVAMDDGNHALYTGADEAHGHFDLGTDMARQTLARLTEDYAISVDIALPDVGNLTQYCWAYGFSKGTDLCLGLINTPDNTNWYYTIKTSEGNADVASRSGLAYGKWHNLTYVQEKDKGRLYVDGHLAKEETVVFRPADIAAELTGACLGRSPFEGDALLTETYFDNFRIYDKALSAAQVAELYARTQALSPSSAEVAGKDDAAEMTSFMKKFNYLHATSELPAETAKGTALEWTFTPEAEGSNLVALNGNTLAVTALPQGETAVRAGTLTASTSGGTTWSSTVYVAPDDQRYGYLYCFMNAGEEITNFALGSKEDKGHVFNVLLDGAEIFDTKTLAGIEGGTRDAYIGRGEAGDGYFITTTDMKQHTSRVWNNRGINLLRSSDLIHWESTTFNFTKGKSVFSDPDATTGCYDTDEEYALINRVWAPQFIWDKDYNQGEGAYLVYYSILSENEGDTHDRIFYSYAGRDFKTLTQPRLFFDPGVAVIDADIVYNPYDSLYHMYYKREGASGTARGIYEATSDRLIGGTWTDVAHVTNEGAELVEGSSTVRRINEDAYNLYYMRYSGGSAYKYCETDHVGLHIGPSSPVEGEGAFQHGSVMTVTEEEYTMLQSWSDLCLLLPEIRQMKAESGTTVFDAAIRQAEEALAMATVPELAMALPVAYKALQTALDDYAQESGGAVDLTFLLNNPDFTDNDASGWSGTAFSAASSGVAEFYDTTFDTYQVLKDMPAGTYRFECQGFYRNGDYAVAYPARQEGTEQLLAVLYVNDAERPFMSLFDESAPYTYTPYTYPDNVWTADAAFNRDGAYAANAVEFILEEPGDLKLGVAKSAYKTHDWTCFDNFRLYYLGVQDYLDLDVSEAGVTTCYAPNAFVMPAGLVGGIVKSIDAEANELTVDWRYPADRVVPAGTGIILEGKTGSYKGRLCTDETAAPADNLLRGTLENAVVDEAGYLYYKLADGNEGVGFYWDAQDGKPITNEAGKAYLAIPDTPENLSADFFRWNWYATGITDVMTDGNAPTDVYTLSGVRIRTQVKMSEALRGLPEGIYIVNGKTLMAK